MVVEALQTIDACIGIATCVIKVCKIAKRYRDANGEGERTRQTVENIHNVLTTIRSALQSGPQPSDLGFLRNNSSVVVSNILKSADNCNENLLALVNCVSEQPVTDLRVLTSDNFEVARRRVTFSSSNLAGLNQRLDKNLGMLTLSLQPLIIAVVTSQGEHQNTRHREVMQQMQNIETLLQGAQDQQRGPATTSRASSSSSRPSDCTIGIPGNILETGHTQHSMQDLDVLLETYGHLNLKNEEAEAVDPNGRTKLMKCVMRDKLMKCGMRDSHTKFSKYLWTTSVDVNAVDYRGFTVLHHAAQSGQIEMVKELFTLPTVSADLSRFVNLENQFGATALHECVLFEYTELAKVLLQHHARVNALTRSGRTPLSLALENKNPKEMVYVLLGYGACDNFEYLPVEEASKARHDLEQYRNHPRRSVSTMSGSLPNSSRASSISTFATTSSGSPSNDTRAPSFSTYDRTRNGSTSNSTEAPRVSLELPNETPGFWTL